MGEYAELRGERVKIGTCESMYYLRADQAHLVRALSGNVDPVHDAQEIRFRFPFPDEDALEPGSFEDFDRGVRIPNYSLPADGSEHSRVQFTSSAGYVLSIDCPEQFGVQGFGPVDEHGLAVHRNGFRGHPVVKCQRWVGEQLVTVIGCGACGSMWRLATLADAAPIADAFLEESARQSCPSWNTREWGDAHSPTERAFLQAMAERILAGYAVREAVV